MEKNIGALKPPICRNKHQHQLKTIAGQKSENLDQCALEYTFPRQSLKVFTFRVK